MNRTYLLRWSVIGVVWLAAAAVGLHGASADLPVMDGVPTAEPEAVGMSSERLERLDRVMRAYIDRGEVAGVVRTSEVTRNLAFGGEDNRTLFMTPGDSLWSMRVKTPGIGAF